MHRERFPVHNLLSTSWKLTRIFLVHSYVILTRGEGERNCDRPFRPRYLNRPSLAVATISQRAP